jgi:hypothetical protein
VKSGLRRTGPGRLKRETLMTLTEFPGPELSEEQARLARSHAASLPPRQSPGGGFARLDEEAKIRFPSGREAQRPRLRLVRTPS